MSDDDYNDDQNSIKVVFLGNAGVGKTSIISKYITNQFRQNEPSTVGAMFLMKEQEYKQACELTKVSLKLAQAIPQFQSIGQAKS